MTELEQIEEVREHYRSKAYMYGNWTVDHISAICDIARKALEDRARLQRRLDAARNLLQEELESCEFPTICEGLAVSVRCWNCRVKAWLAEEGE